MSLKAQAWHVLNNAEDRRYRWFHYVINVLILISVGIVVYEVLYPPEGSALVWLHRVDGIILTVFLFEFLARLWVIRESYPRAVKLSRLKKMRYYLVSRLRFLFSPWGFIDFMALLPLFPFLRSLRILRLLRLARSVQFFRFARPIKTLMAAFRDNILLFGVTTGFLIFVVLLSSVMMFLAEYRINENISSLGDTLWWAIVTVTTVGFGDITPQTGGGRFIGGMLMFSGMFVVAMFAGVISSTLVGHLLPLREEQLRMSSIADHIVVVGWNERMPMMLREFEAEFEDLAVVPKIVIFAPRDRPTNLSSDYLFVQGDFTKDEEFEKARLGYAKTAVVVADESGGVYTKPGIRDGATVLSVFTIRSYLRNFTEERATRLHVVVEILDSENREHAITAGADEVIETTRLGSSLLAHTAGNPGVGRVVTDLVLTSAQNIYQSPLPLGLMDGESMSFGAIQRLAQDRFEILIIGIEHKGKKTLNPPVERPVFVSDMLIYVGRKSLS